jgi:hypothetical protein
MVSSSMFGVVFLGLVRSPYDSLSFHISKPKRNQIIIPPLLTP